MWHLIFFLYLIHFCEEGVQYDKHTIQDLVNYS